MVEWFSYFLAGAGAYTRGQAFPAFSQPTYLHLRITLGTLSKVHLETFMSRLHRPKNFGHPDEACQIARRDANPLEWLLIPLAVAFYKLLRDVPGISRSL